MLECIGVVVVLYFVFLWCVGRTEEREKRNRDRDSLQNEYMREYEKHAEERHAKLVQRYCAPAPKRAR